MPEPAIAVRPDPLELWRLNLPGQAIVRCLVFEQAGVWGVALKTNDQTDDVLECPTREAAIQQAEAWRRSLPERVLDRAFTKDRT